MTGVGREEVYRNRWISAQAMTLKGGVHHKVRVNVTDEKGLWLGPFIDYESAYPTEDEAREAGIRIGMEIVDAQLDGHPCRWAPVRGRWG